MSKAVLLTGGAGFLGSHISDRLIAQGHKVTCLDNLLSGRMQNLSRIMGHERFRFIEGDVRDPLPMADYDEIWNLACPASPPVYQRDPVGTLMINVLGMKNVLDLADRVGAKVLQASTSEVYGDPEMHPQTEAYRGAVNTVGPRACYDEGKRAAEALCFDFHRTRGTRIKVARIFNTYGPRMDPMDGRVVSNFVLNALRAEPLEIYGDGSQTRSFCYYSDLVEGLFRLMESPDPVTGPVNLGNPDEFTVRELADLVIDMTGSVAGLAFRDLPQDDPLQRQPDIALAQRLLGWQPKTPLAEGLGHMIAHMRATLAA